MKIGEKIRQERKRNGLTQEELADKIGVSIKTLQRWENEERSPRTKELKSLSEILGTSVEYLMGETTKVIQVGIDSNSNNSNNNKEGTQTPKEIQSPGKYLGLGYWGSVVDNAKLLARCADEQELSLVRTLLKTALDAVSGASGDYR